MYAVIKWFDENEVGVVPTSWLATRNGVIVEFEYCILARKSNIGISREIFGTVISQNISFIVSSISSSASYFLNI